MEVENELDRLMAMLGGDGGKKEKFCGKCGCPEDEKESPACPTIEVTVQKGMLDENGWLKEEWLQN